MSPPLPTFTTHSLTLQDQEVWPMLWSVNPRKVAGPDIVPSKVLQACADQLAGIFTKILLLLLLLSPVGEICFGHKRMSLANI